jgi:hypothetical protein
MARRRLNIGPSVITVAQPCDPLSDSLAMSMAPVVASGPPVGDESISIAAFPPGLTLGDELIEIAHAEAEGTAQIPFLYMPHSTSRVDSPDIGSFAPDFRGLDALADTADERDALNRFLPSDGDRESCSRSRASDADRASDEGAEADDDRCSSSSSSSSNSSSSIRSFSPKVVSDATLPARPRRGSAGKRNRVAAAVGAGVLDDSGMAAESHDALTGTRKRGRPRKQDAEGVDDAAPRTGTIKGIYKVRDSKSNGGHGVVDVQYVCAPCVCV